MGLIRGSASFTRFWVEGELPEDRLETFPKRIARFAFRNIDEESEQERAVGWVNIMDMFDSRFRAMEFLKEPCIAMSWRVDARKVPAKALARYAREAEDRIKEEEGLAYLSRSRRLQIRAMVKSRLLKRVIPTSQAYDVLWNMETGVLLFGSVSNRLADEFAEFFLNCFELRLHAVFPYDLAWRSLRDAEQDPERLDELSPSFAAEGAGHAAR